MSTSRCSSIPLLALAGAAMGLVASAQGQEAGAAPRNEVGLTLGGFFTSDRTAQQTPLDLGNGTAWQANYGFRLLGGDRAALFGEIHLLANPQRLVGSTEQTLTRDVATLFVTPGIRVKLFQQSALSPYLAIGGGYALFEQSLNRLDGQPNPAPRTINRGVFAFGGGVDVKLWRFLSLRGELRDFYSGSPAYNAPSLSGGQHNVVAGGGFVLRFR